MPGAVLELVPSILVELSISHVLIIGGLGACEVPDATPHSPKIRSKDPLFEAVYQSNITF